MIELELMIHRFRIMLSITTNIVSLFHLIFFGGLKQLLRPPNACAGCDDKNVISLFRLFREVHP